ncbi:MAG: hypothetical protein CFE23_08135 [Flavobacterium sp. BFFFF1]|uniref:DUF4153 domain-containing protein n=1 Tax=Flavobacterium sp. BFFFF1 TaxID=2015557 RepID=UPI000BDC286A|nr:DUF4173 domain-containing protein [Flavobacterium sp. BFFFF1]OYU80681.1 MAG: hypothetical protein CFE23_08135 [Flavobacterium sp. BFFFF1]
MTDIKKGFNGALLFAVVFTLLFHNQYLGLNLLVIESAALLWLAFTKQIDFRNRNHLIFGSGFFITALAVVFVFSDYAVVMNALSLFVFTGILIYPNAKSLITSAKLSFFNIFYAQIRFIDAFFTAKMGGGKVVNVLWKSRIFLIPLVVIAVFIGIYRSSNPVFDKLVSKVLFRVGDFFDLIFLNLDFTMVFTFLLGLAVCNYFFIRNTNEQTIKDDTNARDEVIRIKRRRPLRGLATGLKAELRAGIFLLLALNGVLLVVNCIDVYWVWFNFTWDGNVLKQFVHEGTYLLLLSIVSSILVVLYFFRGNLNFYSGNQFIKTLCLIWIFQNAVLAVSVGVRNLHYIHYFALAYKRIALAVFLVFVLYWLYTVALKVRQKKSAFYLVRANAFVLYLLFISASVFNWDQIIVDYNFRNYRESFVDLDYNSDFSDKVLPQLDKPETELSEIDKLQQTKFHFDTDLMSPAIYHNKMERRKKEFIQKWESKNILSWNYPESQAYEELKQKSR